ncbi:MAG: LamG domain-containing protein, partial [Armatimonadetes bacterium]|nr:LamG domain-containing protein [Armatimonadota bacterium]
FNAPDMTVSFWVKPETLKGRRGLVCKRAGNVAAPFVITQDSAGIGFQACDDSGKWSFNFGSAMCLKANEWTHIAVVMTQGTGITIYADGKVVGQKQNAEKRCANLEPLVMGREAWGGDPPDPKQPGFFVGCLDRVRLWTRALPAAEIEAERAKGVTP